jgi:hypothetical protein
MKITPKELRQIIEEELQAVVQEGFKPISTRSRNPFDNNPKATEILTAKVKEVAGPELENLIGWFKAGAKGNGWQDFKKPYLDATKKLDYDTAMMLVGTGGFGDSSDMMIGLAKHLASQPQGLTEDGHTDVPSAVRKLKTSMEDAMEILNALEQMPDTELPSWWMSKVTLAADYLNKSRDYLLVSEKLDPSDGAGAYVKDFRKSDAPQFKGKGKKKRQQMAVAAYLQDKEEGK